MGKTMLESNKKYEAQIDDYGVKTTKAGKPYIQVYFHIPGFGSIPWNGHMTEKTMEKTFKTLATLGFTSGDLTPIEDGPLSKALDLESKFMVTVEQQKDKDGEPTKYWNVKFVNKAKAPKFERTEKSALDQYANDWAAYKAANGIKSEEKKLDF